MRTRLMEVEQDKKRQVIPSRDMPGAGRPAFSHPQAGLLAVQAGLGNRTAQRLADRLRAGSRAETGVKDEKKENRTGLPDQLKLGIEQLSGLSLDQVKVHYGSDKPAHLQAYAYTQGAEIYIAPGQEKHLPHEAWHVVQQAQGRVNPTTKMMDGTPVNDDSTLEREADVMGARAEKDAQTRQIIHHNTTGSMAAVNSQVVLQRQIKGGIGAVTRLLEKNSAWYRFIKENSHKAKKYKEALDHMLSTLHLEWETGFDPEVIADSILVNDFDAEGIANAMKSVVRGIEEHIDEEVLSGGHSGEKHYGKDEKYQKERMESEHKRQVTTLEDCKITRQFFTVMKLSVKDDLFALLHDIIFDIAQSNQYQPATIANIKAITDGYVGTEKIFDAYRITLTKIKVKGVAGGGVTIDFTPELESLKAFPKTEYTGEESAHDWSPIVSYWGSNRPVITVQTNDDYDALFDRLKVALEAPVTAY